MQSSKRWMILFQEASPMKANAYLTLLLCGVLLFSFSACGTQTGGNEDSSAAESSTEQNLAADDTPYSVDFRLSTGHYIAGIDFPAGVYHLEAVEWCGTVSSSNGAIQLDMGTSDHNMDGLNRYTLEADDIELSSGTMLNLSGGVRLRLICENADPTSLNSRSQSITESVTLARNATYTAGVDFPAGVYDFTATNGVGNVESSNMHDGGICEVMGTTWRITEGFGFCDQTCQNVELPDGTTLQVSGVDLYLTPSK